jgi:hypothetical protein
MDRARAFFLDMKRANDVRKIDKISNSHFNFSSKSLWRLCVLVEIFLCAIRQNPCSITGNGIHRKGKKKKIAIDGTTKKVFVSA